MGRFVRKGERGSALVIFLIVAVVAVVGVVAWRIADNKKTTTNSSSGTVASSTSVDASCNAVYHDTKLCRFASSTSNFDKLAYTAVATGKDAQGQATSITIQQDGKGNTAVSLGSGAQAYSSIQIGSTTYIKSPGSSIWLKYTSNAPTAGNPASPKPEFSKSNTPADKQIQYKYLGTAKCGNLNCYKYQIVDPASAGTTVTVLFDTKNYRMQEFSSTSTDGTTSDMKFTYGSVKISVPSPVNDAPTASNIPTQAQIQAAEQAAQAANQ